MRISKFVVFFIFLFASHQALALNEQQVEMLNEEVKNLLQAKLQNSHHYDELEVIIHDPNLHNYKIDMDGKIAVEKILDIDYVQNSFRVLLKAENIEKDILIKAKFIEYINVPVFKIKINSGYIIEESDLIMQKIDLRKISHNVIKSKEELIGKTPKHLIQANIPVNHKMIAELNIINKKDKINAIYQKGAVTLTMSATALDAGAIGQVIRVKNTRSNAIFNGVVINNNTVKIE